METYANELWEEVKQVSTDLFYLEDLRADKARIEPYYKGLLSLCAIVTALCSFVGAVWLIHATALMTAVVTMLPILFPVLPSGADFAKMDALILALKQRQAAVEEYWYKGFSAENRAAYRASKEAFAPTEVELSALFGKIGKRREKEAQELCDRYLDRFFTSEAYG